MRSSWEDENPDDRGENLSDRVTLAALESAWYFLSSITNERTGKPLIALTNVSWGGNKLAGVYRERKP
jgi:hypothetical protein